MSDSRESEKPENDKPAIFRSDMAEQPVADEGAEKIFPSDDNWDSEKPYWWAEEGTSAYTTHYSSTYPTAGGAASYRAYSYDDAFDDVDDRWYRKNKFQTRKYRDYSPSRLFRSSFSGGYDYGYSYRSSSSYNYTSGIDSDLANKAIRALRSLTRNANTVADKTAKINYVVKFSGGADINTNGDQIAAKTGKQQQQVIFVSPDDLVKADDEDATDAAVDALTGFVLLRVQIAQTIDRPVIEAVNKTTASAIPAKLADLILQAPVTTEIAENTTTDYIDSYAAGMLTKGMFTRLCRRGVVKDWGGFAPYFVRHARKVEAIRDKLAPVDGTKLSVERLAAQITYNFVSDENPIPLDADIEAIVAKHLGAELAIPDILPACAALVADLRAHLEKSGDAEAGEMESALRDILNELASKNDEKHINAQKALESRLNDVGEFLDNARECEMHTAFSDSELDELEQIHKNAQQMRALEKIVDAVEQNNHAIQSAVSEADKHQKNETATQTIKDAAEAQLVWLARAAAANIKSNINHYITRIPGEFLADRGVDLAALSETAKAVAASNAESIRKNIEELLACAAEVAEATAAATRKETKKLRAATTNVLENNAAKMQQIGANLDGFMATATAIAEDAAALVPENPNAAHIASLRPAVCHGENGSRAMLTNTKAQNSELRQELGEVRGLRKVSDIFARAKDEAESVGMISRTFYERMNSRVSHGPLSKMMAIAENRHSSEMRNHVGALENFKCSGDWRPDGIRAFMSEIEKQRPSFGASLVRQTHEKLLQALLAQLKAKMADKNKLESERDEADSALPDDFSELDPGLQQTINNIAEHIGLTPRMLFEILRRMQNDDDDSAQNTQAAELGKKLVDNLLESASKINPIDEQLFGAQVLNTSSDLLDGSLDTIHDEAERAVEEDYVAYTNANNTRPKITVHPQEMNLAQARTVVQRVIAANRGGIDRIRNALTFHSDKRTDEMYGLTSGDLDEGNLHKLRYDSEHIWSQRKVTRLPDVAVGILVDQSGSMSGNSGGRNGGPKIAQAREMCIVLAAAVKLLPGVHLHIYGHTANSGAHGCDSDLQLFEHYSSYGDARNADISRLGGIKSMCNNYDGYAIKETAKRIALDPAKRKYLFIIADGMPSGQGYGGEEAEKHVKSVCSYVRNKLKIQTYAFGVGLGSDTSAFREQYGENNVVFLSQVQQALPKIVRFLRNVLQKEKTLVTDVD